MNRQIRRLTIAVLVIYGILFLRLNQVQVLDADAYNERPDNNRQVEADFNNPRGTISTIDGTLLARSREVEGQYQFQREYPEGDEFAHITGYYSIMFGSDGVERTYNDELAGRIAALQLEGFANPFVERSSVGNVVLSLRADVQEVARQQLGERKGSVVALDPRTGAILAMWSFPSYDPNFVSSNDEKIARASRELLQANPDKPLLAKSYRERFFPGSTFKVVTASAGVDSGKVTVTEPAFPVVRSYTPPLTSRPISNFDGAACGGTLDVILRQSCNTSFAQMGAEVLGPDIMVGESEEFGFNDHPPIDLPQPADSVFPTDYGARVRASTTPGWADVYENTPALAQASIGQFDVAATPLQMALVASSIANGGPTMAPHVLDRVEDSDGGLVSRYEANVWRTPVSSSTAATVRNAMLGVVTEGTASRAAIPGFEVGAKTGTAQLGTDPPRSHAWLVAFAGPPGAPAQVAVSVLIEGQEGASEQTGGRVA
ncbi:MAG TPA: penicillin-binding transpeptidase domain-containing protein, partial [Microthrixaceae bacterium]|nr:penicillin-binding transpeptidase domain-containing protein [Microthrixaceae bacterium]